MKGICMTSIQPVCPNCNQPCPTCNPAVNTTQPQVNNYSGVTIDIHNPAVNVPPFNSIYDMPQTSIYAEPISVEEVK